MKRTTINLPTLFGDHHVVEVRRILLETPGVKEVYASSSFQMVEVGYEPDQLSEDMIRQKLEVAGYAGDWAVPTESGTAPYLKDGSQAYFRHTEVFETARQVMSFAQDVGYTGRPLWNCPGFGVIKNRMEE